MNYVWDNVSLINHISRQVALVLCSIPLDRKSQHEDASSPCMKLDLQCLVSSFVGNALLLGFATQAKFIYIGS